MKGWSSVCGLYAIECRSRDECLLRGSGSDGDFDWTVVRHTLSKLHFHSASSGTLADGFWRLTVLLLWPGLFAISQHETGFDRLFCKKIKITPEKFFEKKTFKKKSKIVSKKTF